jgi:hypothetical protein
MSLTLFETLRDAFIRTNKRRRPAMALKAGYDTPEKYLAYLDAQIAGYREDVDLLEPDVEEPQQILDMVIAFDTTGSMASYIGRVKEHVETIIPQLLNDDPNLKISIVAFGDYCDMIDMKGQKFGNAYQVLPLTNDKQRLISFVRNARDTGGGDANEFYELVIRKITNETDWRPGSEKAVLLIADAQPHTDREYQVSYKRFNGSFIDWRNEAKKSAAMNIKWDTLSIPPSHDWYSELSEITGGLHLPFSQSDETHQLVKMSTVARSKGVDSAAFINMEAEMRSGSKGLGETYAKYKKEIKR